MAATARIHQLRQPARSDSRADDPATTITMRVRLSSVAALKAEAAARGLTVKQVIFHALYESGVAVADPDLRDLTPTRKPRAGKSGSRTR